MVGRKLFTVMGVSIMATKQSRQFVPPKLFIVPLIAFFALHDQPMMERFLAGLIFTGLLLIVLFLHILGHILSSTLVSPSMTEARITPVLIETLSQNDPASLSPRIHLVRSMGGPMMNLVLGLFTLIILLGSAPSPMLAFFAGANLVITAIVLLPFDSVDGGVIWRELSRSRRRQ